MKRFIGLFVTMVALIATSTVVPLAQAQVLAPVLTTRILPGKETNASVAGAYVDSVAFTIPTRTTSTDPETLLVDTSDWDWVYPYGSAAPTTAAAVAYINFTIPAGSLGKVASGVDSVFCLYQTSPDGNAWHVTQTATSLATWTDAGNFARFPILADQDALNAASFFGQRYIRIIVCGDTGGKLGGVTASVTYWRRAGAPDLVQNGPPSFR